MRSIVIAVLALGCVNGCARSAEERQLDEMREAITHVDEKLTAKELAEIVKQKSATRTTMALPSRQRVVRFEDGTEEEAAAPSETAGFEPADDTSVRPIIKVKGVPHSRGGDVVEQTMPDENVQPEPQ